MKRFGQDFHQVCRSRTRFDEPVLWKEPARVFVCPWSDFFIAAADAWRDEAWDVIRQCPHLTFQIPTKRIERVNDETLPWGWGSGWCNVWLGVSVENQEVTDRLDRLLEIPAEVRWISAEPLLGPLDLRPWLEGENRLAWVVAGGESDLRNPRPAKVDWFRDLRDQCQTANVPFFLKQLGGSRRIDGGWGGNSLDGRTWEEFPR